MAGKLGVMGGSWSHYNGNGYSNINSNRVVTKNVIKSKYTIRCQLGGGLEWYGSVAMFYDSSSANLAYTLETLETHYNDSNDKCDDGSGYRGGTIIESTCASSSSWKYDTGLNPNNMALLQKEDYYKPTGIPKFGTYSKLSESPYGKIGYMLMQPLAKSNQSSIDSRMPNATTSNTYRPSAFIDQNPYGSVKYYTVDLMLLCELHSAYSNTYQVIDDLGSNLYDYYYHDCWTEGQYHGLAPKIEYFIGMGAKYGQYTSTSDTYVRSNINISQSGFYGEGQTTNQTSIITNINYIPNGRCATYYDSVSEHYLVGIIRTKIQISDVSKIYPIISVGTSSGFSDIPKSYIKYIKYLGYTTDTNILNGFGKWLPSGYDSQLTYIYSFYIPVDDTFHTWIRNYQGGVGRGLVIRGCKYQ